MESILADVKPAADNPVHSYMEEDQVVETDVTRQFYFLTKCFGWEHALPLIRPIPKGPPPLQAADMVAYEGSRWCSEQVLARSGRPGRILYRELCRFPQLLFHYMAREKYRQISAASMVVNEEARSSPERLAQASRQFAAAAKRTQRERSALGAERKKARKR